MRDDISKLSASLGVAGFDALRRLLARAVIGPAFLAVAVSCSGGGHSVAPATSLPETSTATPSTAAVVSVSATIQATPRPLPGVPFPPDQALTLEGLVNQTAELRGLMPKTDIEERLIDRQEAADYLEASLDPGDRAALKLHEEVYKALGLIPQDADLVALQISLLRSLVLGFYDPDVKVLFVLSDIGLTSSITRSTIVHEVTHALQDQYYDLNAIDLSSRDDWDRNTAFIDVVEGDARATESKFTNGGVADGAGCDNSSFALVPGSNIPIVIQRELQAPYATGLCLISREADVLPDRVDTLFRNLPRSTEQVLHPEKYLAGEDPVHVDLPSLAGALGPAWKQTASGTFGEFALQNLLLLGVKDPPTVRRGADGWGGDRWGLYTREDGQTLIHLGTVWDSQAEANEFWSVLLQSLNGRSNGSVSVNASARSVTWDDGGRALRAGISGAMVTIVMSADAGATETAARALGIG